MNIMREQWRQVDTSNLDPDTATDIQGMAQRLGFNDQIILTDGAGNQIYVHPSRVDNVVARYEAMDNAKK